MTKPPIDQARRETAAQSVREARDAIERLSDPTTAERLFLVFLTIVETYLSR